MRASFLVNNATVTIVGAPAGSPVTAIPTIFKGDPGPRPAHSWSGTEVAFENPDGSLGPFINLKGDIGDLSPEERTLVNQAVSAGENLGTWVDSQYPIGAPDVTNTANTVNITSGQYGSAIPITVPSRLRRIRFHRTSAGNHSTRIMTRDADGVMSLRQAVTLNSLAIGYHDIEVDVALQPGDYLVALGIGLLGRANLSYEGGMYWSSTATMPFTDTSSTDIPPSAPLVEWVIERTGRLSEVSKVTQVATAQEVPQPWSAQASVDAALVPDNLFGRGLDIAWGDNWRQFGSPFQNQRKAPAASTGRTPRLDLIGMISGQSLDIVASTTTEVYAGANRTFVGANIPTGSNRVVVSTNQWITFTVGRNGVIHVDQHGNTFTFSTITRPTPTETFICGGQSHMNLAFDLGFIGGFADGIRSTSWVQSVLDPAPHFVNTAIGATAIFKSNVSASSDRFWVNDDDPDNLTPGPALLSARTKIAENTTAGLPSPRIGLWSQGDANVLSMEFNNKTHAQLVAGILYILDDYKALCPDVQFFVSTHPYEDLMPQHKGAIAVRAAYLDAIQARSWLHLGPETYDMPQAFVQTHSNEAGHYRWGYRFARFYANHMAAQTNDLGPLATGYSINTDRTQITITLDRPFSATRLLRQILIPQPDMPEGRYRGPMPLGIAVTNATTGVVVPMAYATASGSTVTLTSSTPISGGVYVNCPAGTGGFAGRYGSRIVSLDQHPTSYGLPLRSQRSQIL